MVMEAGASSEPNAARAAKGAYVSTDVKSRAVVCCVRSDKATLCVTPSSFSLQTTGESCTDTSANQNNDLEPNDLNSYFMG